VDLPPEDHVTGIFRLKAEATWIPRAETVASAWKSGVKRYDSRRVTIGSTRVARCAGT